MSDNHDLFIQLLYQILQLIFILTDTLEVDSNIRFQANLKMYLRKDSATATKHHFSERKNDKATIIIPAAFLFDYKKCIGMPIIFDFNKVT